MEKVLVRKKPIYALVSIILLNAFDGLATFMGLQLGIYIELNKFLALVYEFNPLLFLVVKIIIPTMILAILIPKITRNLSVITRILITIINIIYIILCLYHIVLLMIVFFR